jgi:hypothetical protein
MDITQEELTKLANTKSMQEWDNTCDEVKKARGGVYPPDWFPKVMMSGLAKRAQANWKCDCSHGC